MKLRYWLIAFLLSINTVYGVINNDQSNDHITVEEREQINAQRAIAAILQVAESYEKKATSQSQRSTFFGPLSFGEKIVFYSIFIALSLLYLQVPS